MPIELDNLKENSYIEDCIFKFILELEQADGVLLTKGGKSIAIDKDILLYCIKQEEKIKAP